MMYKESKQETKKERKKKKLQKAFKDIDSNFPEFKKAEKKYKLYKDYKTDFSELLDFSSENLKLEGLPITKMIKKDYVVYKFDDPQGVYLIKNFIDIPEQIFITNKCLNEYHKKPYRTNLFIYENPNEIDNSINMNDQSHLTSNDPYDLDKFFVREYSRYYFNKKIRWANVGYQYDWNNRTYPSEKCELPPELESLSNKTRDLFSEEIPNIFDYKAESTIINFYDSKNYMGGHLDDGEKDQISPIFSYSFGLSCVFLMGGKTKEVKPWAIKIDSGDLLIMSGYSRTCYHGVPRIIENSFDEKRFNEYLKQKLNCEEINYKREKAEIPEIDEFFNDEIHVVNYLKENRLNLNFRQVFN